MGTQYFYNNIYHKHQDFAAILSMLLPTDDILCGAAGTGSDVIVASVNA
jgi:hypothetical protein